MRPLCEAAASSSLLTLVQKCTAITSLEKARQLHALIITATSTSRNAESPYLNNNLLSMYARCGSLSHARKLFDKMPQRSLVSYNAMTSAYSRSSEFGILSFELFNYMGSQGFRPNGSTFVSLLQACCSLEEWIVGSVVHAQVVKFGFLDNVQVQTSLLGMYSGQGDLESAGKIFNLAVEKDAVLWNSMIYGNLRNGKIKEACFLLRAMVRSSVAPNEFTYSMLLNACGRLGNGSCGEAIHAQTVVSNMLVDLPLQNALLDMYCDCGTIGTAYNVFKRISSPDLISWNTVISGCAEYGEGGEAMNLFVQLLRMSFPKPDEYTFAAVISATVAFPYINHGEPLHAQVLKRGLARSVFIGTVLLSMYFRNGNIKSAHGVFYLIEEKDIVLWTEMIMGYSRLGDGESAMMLFRKMIQDGQKCDSFVLSGALSACADLATLKLGEMIHALTLKLGCEIEMSVSGCLVDMYAKNGNIQAAQSIFSQVSYPDLMCWNSMLAGYSHHGMVEKAMKIFQHILDNGEEPDQVTFLSLLSACSHSGMVEKGKMSWNLMKKNGITPGPKHYSCMVGLLSRAGLLDEAQQLITQSAYGEECLELWRTLLSSCVGERNQRIGLTAAEQVLRLDPDDSATHILLSNLYAAVGKWDDVAEIRRKIRGLMLEKDPGLSWIESKNDFHVFSSSDQLNLMVDEAQSEVHRLRKNMLKPVVDELDMRICSG